MNSQDAEQPKKKSRKWLWILGGIFLFLVLISLGREKGEEITPAQVSQPNTHQAQPQTQKIATQFTPQQREAISNYLTEIMRIYDQFELGKKNLMQAGELSQSTENRWLAKAYVSGASETFEWCLTELRKLKYPPETESIQNNLLTAFQFFIAGTKISYQGFDEENENKATQGTKEFEKGVPFWNKAFDEANELATKVKSSE